MPRPFWLIVWFWPDVTSVDAAPTSWITEAELPAFAEAVVPDVEAVLFCVTDDVFVIVVRPVLPLVCRRVRLLFCPV